ncbi:MAG: AAA family ATPase, partial [Bradymonadaceae bacterium]
EDVLVVDDLLGLVRAGRTQNGDSNVARFIEPYIEQGRFGVITEATEQTWNLARELAPGFVDKFRRVQVPELGYVPTLAIVGDQVRDLESYHPVHFTPDGVEAVLHHSRRFFRQAAFPGKAIQLVKQCFNEALRRYGQEVVELVKVDADLVADVLHRQTGLPLSILKQDQRRAPGTIRAAFESRVFGQPEAMEAMTHLVLTIEQGLSQPGRPLGTFLLIGPSGVGKTETARALATDLFGSPDRMIRLDMSEFGEPMALTRLIGTPDRPDGELTGKVRLQPFSVLLFDEVEKAHPRVLDLLLQLLGDGRLTDAAGRTVDFCNTVVMMTSNLGASSEERWMGFAEKKEPERILHYRRSAEQFFRPEFFNRIDRVIAYRPLESETLRRIGRRTVRELLGRRGLRQAQIVVDVAPNLIESLAMRSVDRRYGARTLARRIERELITPLARELTSHGSEKELTLVTMRPGESAEVIDLRVELIARAPFSKTAAREVSTDAEAETDELELILRRVTSAMEELEGSPDTRRLLAEHESILAQLNDQAGSGTWSEELSERLRYREMFRHTLENLRRRVDGLLDAENTGSWKIPDLEGLDKVTRHRWLGIANQIDHHLAWAHIQLASLREKEREGALFIIRGLCGPCQPMLRRWHRWLELLAESLEFQLQSAFLDGDTWREEPGWESVEAFAIATECPGALTLLKALEGYCWIPSLPSHGQHVLLYGRAFEHGVASDADLIEVVRSLYGQEGHEGRRTIEFIEQDGAIEDVRLGRKMAMPEDRARAGDFIRELAMERVK